MARIAARRLVAAGQTLLVLSVLLFIWLRQLPGGPASALLGERVTPERVDDLNRLFGLNDSVIRQYGEFLRRAVTGDLGTSLLTGQKITSELGRALPATIELSVAALAIAVGVGIPLGYLVASRRSEVLRWLATAGALLCVALPVFFVAFVLKEIFAVELGWLPPSGRRSAPASPATGTGFVLLDAVLARDPAALLDGLSHLVLPAFALSAVPLAIVLRMTYGAVRDVLDTDYVRAARAKGLAERTVRVRHVLRNALLPVSTTVGLQLGSLLSGAVLTERIFNWGGIGSLIEEGIRHRDYPRLQALILLTAVAYLLINLLVDLSYVLLDPRVRLR